MRYMVLLTKWISKHKDEPFVLHNDRETGIIIFSCTSNLRCLCNEVQEIFIDGTFKCCSKYLLQMYNIHGLKNGHYVSLVFTLLSGKSELVYRKMWTLVASLCKGLDLNLSPETIHIDFEVAMHNVLRDIFTNSRILCCRSISARLGGAKYKSWDSAHNTRKITVK